MEVHHHPGLKRKNFKEYFLQFVVIFLAVTMGYMAKNIREQINDKAEMQNNMPSMVADFKSDFAIHNATVASTQPSGSSIDALPSLLKTELPKTSEIYFPARYITGNHNAFVDSCQTFDLMKSSGALKLIEPGRMHGSISDPYLCLQFFVGLNDLQRQKLTGFRLVNGRVFDGCTFQKMFRALSAPCGFKPATIKKQEANPYPRTDDLITTNWVIVAYPYLYSVKEVNENIREALIKMLPGPLNC